jgi:hypothetical protein
MCDSITHVMIVLKPYLLLDFEERINIIFEQSIRACDRGNAKLRRFSPFCSLSLVLSRAPMSPTSHEVFARRRCDGRALAEGCQHRYGKVGTSIYPEYGKGGQGGIGHEEGAQNISPNQSTH